MIAPGYIVLGKAIASFVFSDETLQSGLEAYPRARGQRFAGAQVSLATSPPTVTSPCLCPLDTYFLNPHLRLQMLTTGTRLPSLIHLSICEFLNPSPHCHLATVRLSLFMDGYAPGRQNVMPSASTQPQDRAPSPTGFPLFPHLPVTTQSEALPFSHSWPASPTHHQTEALLSHLTSPPPSFHYLNLFLSTHRIQPIGPTSSWELSPTAT